METKFLFPSRYKKIGWFMLVPFFILGILKLKYSDSFEFDFLNYDSGNLVKRIFNKGGETLFNLNNNNFTDEIISMGLIIGLILTAFSKEKIEDEMVQRTRLDSFQFAALTQIIFTISGFLFMLFAGDPGESGLMLFFIVLVFLFWLSFIGRFNFILHVKLK